MQATEKKMNNKIWLSILSVGVVIALVLGIVALVNHGDTKANAIPTINQQVDNIKNTLPELEKVSTELKGYIDTLETTTEKLQSDLTATNTAIDTLETEVYGKVDAEKTATLGQLKADKAELEGKISESEKKVLGELNALKTSIEGQSATVNADITALKAKDTELDQKIADLKAYVDGEIKATKDWANVTFATLAQYDAIQTEIATIKQSITDINADITAIEADVKAQVEAINKSISDLDAELAAEVKKVTDGYTAAIGTAKTEITAAYTTAIATAITNSETSMKTWVTETLTNGYYDIAAIDAKLAAIDAKITTYDDTEIKASLEEQKEALEVAKTELTTAYEAAIKKAIEDNNGVIDDVIAAAITAATNNLQNDINVIKTEITSIKSRLDNLEGAVNELDDLRNVVFVPEYADGKVLMDYTSKTATMSFAVNGFVDFNKYEVCAFLSYTKDPTDRGTTASTGPVWIEIPVSSAEFNSATDQNGQAAGSRGMLKVTVNGANLTNAFWIGDVEAILYVQIQDKSGEAALDQPVISDTVPVIAHNYVTTSATINDFENGNTYEGKVTE